MSVHAAAARLEVEIFPAVVFPAGSTGGGGPVGAGVAVVVLEEAVRSRKDDPDYKNDVRYAKLWLAYARHVEKPDIIYVFLLKNEIGVRNAQLYEDYSTSLESQDR